LHRVRAHGAEPHIQSRELPDIHEPADAARAADRSGSEVLMITTHRDTEAPRIFCMMKVLPAVAVLLLMSTACRTAPASPAEGEGGAAAAADPHSDGAQN